MGQAGYWIGLARKARSEANQTLVGDPQGGRIDHDDWPQFAGPVWNRKAPFLAANLKEILHDMMPAGVLEGAASSSPT